VIGGFAVPPDPNEFRSPPTPGVPPRYSLIDRGPGEGEQRFALLYGTAPLIHTRNESGVVHHLLWHIFEEAIRHTGDYLLVHAGAVVTPSGEGVLLPGDSGSGKTTLVAALVREGFGYLSDEAGTIDPVRRRLHPHPRALTFKLPPGALFPGVRSAEGDSPFLDGRWFVRPDEIRPGALAGPCPVRFIVAPRYEAGAPTQLTPMTPAEATVVLADKTLNLAVYRSRALPLLADIARGATSYRLVSGDVADAVRSVIALTNGGAAVALPSANGSRTAARVARGAKEPRRRPV
jgi:hypothetical protein